MSVLEKEVEAAFVKKIKAMGGTCEKFTSPARRSVPDRLFILPGGRIGFAEIKRPGAKPTEAQERDHKRRRDLGAEVWVIDSKEAVDAFA